MLVSPSDEKGSDYFETIPCKTKPKLVGYKIM